MIGLTDSNQSLSGKTNSQVKPGVKNLMNKDLYLLSVRSLKFGQNLFDEMSWNFVYAMVGNSDATLLQEFYSIDGSSFFI